jgi:hypothetical protein
MIRTKSKRFVYMLVLIAAMLLGYGSASGQDSRPQPMARLICGPSDQDGSSRAISQPQSDSASDQYIELLRKDVRSLKKQVIAANLDLTDKEAEKFWPIYDQYTVELVKINDTKVALIKDYAQNYSSMTDEQAEAYVKGRAAVDESVNRLRLRYFPIFHRVLTGKTAATFFQIEWRISLMIDLQLASQMPLIQP